MSVKKMLPKYHLVDDGTFDLLVALDKKKIIIKIHPLGTTNVHNFHGNPSCSCPDISVWTQSGGPTGQKTV